VASRPIPSPGRMVRFRSMRGSSIVENGSV
jgi:hypothetical protein